LWRRLIVLPELAQMQRAHAQRAGERAAQRFVGGDQGLESFVDLPVLTLASFLHGLHEQQANAHHQAGHQQQAQHSGEQGGPGAEIKRRAHGVLSNGVVGHESEFAQFYAIRASGMLRQRLQQSLSIGLAFCHMLDS
jgi:hypothetical protein